MNALYFFVVFAGLVQTIRGETCNACATTYGTEKTAAGNDDAKKCTAIKKFADCLMAASGEGCKTGDNSPATQIGSAGLLFKDAEAIATCTIDPLCNTCQLNYQTAVLARTASTKVTTKCKEGFAYASCVELTPSTEKACDGAATQATMATNSLAKAMADCAYAGTTAVKSSVAIMVAALFLSYLKF